MNTAEKIVEVAMNNADNMNDLLNGLVERAAKNPGEPFKPEVRECLIALKNNDRAAYETLRDKLKAVKVRVTVLDKLIHQESGEVSELRQKQADILTGIAGEAVLFHTPETTGYADITIKGHRETWPIRSKGFRRWLTRRYFEETKGAPNSEAMQSALNVIEAEAHYDAPEYAVYVRIARQDGKIYLDLADADWRTVEISAEGWRVISNPPVRFRRASGMLPLPVPQKDGKITLLKDFLNVRDEGDFILVVAWILVALRGQGPFFILVITGEQGTAKSTFMRLLRLLIDPNSAALRTLPGNDRDLFIAATNGYIIAFDNVSYLPDWLSDALCRLSTGGGFATRSLYTDGEEALFDAMRPMMLNGITDMATRGDLADRGVGLTLQPILDENRRTEEELLADFESKRPLILGVLLDMMAHGLKMLPQTRLSGMPRMADCALWATACETAAWRAGAFMAAYTGNRNDMVETVIESDHVASALRTFMDTRKEPWTGTSTKLLTTLNASVDDATQNNKLWPSTARALSGRLRRVATALRKAGINIVFDQRDPGKKRDRTITISQTPEKGVLQPSESFAPSAVISDNTDGTDANIPTQSNEEHTACAWRAKL